ncbi:MAG: hypothetical protein AAFP02_01315 [Bacteroidota bacterium]
MDPYIPFILLSMVLANVGHILLVKRNAFAQTAVPISERLFGSNKTWRGFLVLISLNAIVSALLNLFFGYFGWLEALWLGGLLGLAYMLSELPNSWLKRRQGIASGAESGWFVLIDKTDSSMGVCLTCMLLFGLSLRQTLLLFLLGSATHVFFSWLLVVVGVKKRF